MMKLKNIVYAGLALLICAGCSKDEERETTGGKASISIKVSASGTKTKAHTPDENNKLVGEANVNNITVLIFNEAGSGLLSDPYWQDTQPANGSVAITNVPTIAAKAQLVFVANTDRGTFDDVASYADFENKLAQLATQRQDNLTMSSQVFVTRESLAAGENYIGYESMGALGNINGVASPIEITRLSARLDVFNMRTNFTRPILQGRAVTVENISVRNQKTVSRFFSPGYWGTVMVDANLANSAEAAINLSVNNATTFTEVPYAHYVMENKTDALGATLDTPTQFVIKATLAATSEYKAETRYFSATINENGRQKGYDHNYVKRNYVYKVTVTFRDNSFDGDHEEDPDPDPVPPPLPEPVDGLLDVQVIVVGWGPIQQDVEI